jgi:hypothetical protein
MEHAKPSTKEGFNICDLPYSESVAASGDREIAPATRRGTMVRYLAA